MVVCAYCFYIKPDYWSDDVWCIACLFRQVSEGLVLRDGSRLKYPVNGMTQQLHLTLMLFIAVFFLASYVFPDCDVLAGFSALCCSAVLVGLGLWLGMPLAFLFELIIPLAVAAIALSYLLAIYLYIRSFWAPAHALALGGNSGEIL